MPLNNSQKTKVAILGSGNIGTDLLVKVLRSPFLFCGAFIGRNLTSPGLSKAISLGIPVSSESIGFLKRNPETCDIVFDATSAMDHQQHAPILKRLGKIAIDLTPAQVGTMCVPSVNMEECLKFDNINMISCGGQASLPLIHALKVTQPFIEYVEVVSSIASRSAGPATRRNLDEYIHTTEKAIRHFSGCQKAKAILNLNPAQPCIDMQTTVLAKVNSPNIPLLEQALQELLKKVQSYVPGYRILVGPLLENGRVVIMVKVSGLGDYLPSYAGNLDIINCAAIATAESFAKNTQAALSLIRGG